MSAKLPAALGQLTMAASMSVAIASNQSNLPTNNAQWGGVATSLGQKAMASSVPVTLSSDQSALPVSQSGTWNIGSISGTVPLPTGAATEATLLAAKVDLDKFTFTATRLLVDGSGVTQPISAASLPLPAGAATSALQTTGNSSLSSIDGKLPATLGQKPSATSLAVVIASDQSSIAVTGPLTDTQLRAVAVPVSGTVSARLQDGAGTLITSTGGALNVSIATPLSVDITGNHEDLDTGGGVDNHEVFAIGLPGAGGHVVGGTATNPLRTDPTGTTTQPVSGPLTDTQLRATAVPVSGTFFQVTQPVSGTFFQATQPVSIAATVAVSGPLTDTQLRATAVPVSGPLTDTQLRASSVPVIGPLTDTQLRATAVPTSAAQSGTWNINNISGTISLPTGASTEATLLAAKVDLDKFTFTATRLLVDGSGVTQPVSGTVAVTQATGTNLHAVIDSGTVTANIGTTNGLALDATVANVQGTVGAGAAATKSGLAGGIYNSTLPTLTTGQQVALQVDVNGKLLTDTTVVFPGGANQLGAVEIIDPAGNVLDLVKESDNYSNSLHSLIMMGVDDSAPTRKIRPIATDIGGHLQVHIRDSANNLLTSTLLGAKQSLDVNIATVGQTTMAASVPVTIASNQTALDVSQSGTWNINNISGTISLPTLAATSTLQTTGNSSLSSIDTKTPALGQTTMAASTPVVIASNQTGIPVTGTFFQATQPVSGTVAATQSGTWNINNVSGTVSLPTGASTEATLAKLTVAQGTALGTNTQAMVGGSVTTAAPTYTTGQISPLSLTTTGDLRTTSTIAGSVTVTQATGTNLHAVIDSGTITANAGTGSFTVAQATGTNLHTVVDSGTITANIGTSGSLALEASLVKLNVSQSAALGSNTGPMVQGAVSTAAPSYTTGNINPLSLTTGGALRTNDSSFVAQASTTSGQTGGLIQGAVTTAAPTYTTAQTNPLSLTTGGLLRTQVAGDVASGTADAGNPVKVGYVARITLPTAVADGQRVNGIADKVGREAVVLGTVRDLKGIQNTTITASTTETTIVTAGGAGVFNDIVTILVANTSNATNTRIDFRDSTGGTIRFSLQCPGNQTTGFTIPGESIPQTTAANNWTAQCATSTTDIRIFALFERNS